MRFMRHAPSPGPLRQRFDSKRIAEQRSHRLHLHRRLVARLALALVASASPTLVAG
jgi:hypothetical protein